VGNDVVDRNCFDVASLLGVVTFSFEAFVVELVVVVVLASLRREV